MEKLPNRLVKPAAGWSEMARLCRAALMLRFIFGKAGTPRTAEQNKQVQYLITLSGGISLDELRIKYTRGKTPRKRGRTMQRRRKVFRIEAMNSRTAPPVLNGEA